MKKKIIFFIIYIIIFILFVLLMPQQFKILITILGSITTIFLAYFMFFKKKKVIDIKKEDIQKVEEKRVIKVIPQNLPDNFNFDEFENEVKKLYINIQKSFMNFNYEYLEKHLSPTLYSQYKKQMDNLRKNNKVAVRSNINYTDFIFNDFDNNTFNVSIGVFEDKYTKNLNDKDRLTGITYESYYELVIIKKEELILDSLKLVYSHSKRS